MFAPQSNGVWVRYNSHLTERCHLIPSHKARYAVRDYACTGEENCYPYHNTAQIDSNFLFMVFVKWEEVLCCCAVVLVIWLGSYARAISRCTIHHTEINPLKLWVQLVYTSVDTSDPIHINMLTVCSRFNFEVCFLLIANCLVLGLALLLHAFAYHREQCACMICCTLHVVWYI